VDANQNKNTNIFFEHIMTSKAINKRMSDRELIIKYYRYIVNLKERETTEAMKACEKSGLIDKLQKLGN